MPPELHKKVLLLLSSPAEQLQVLSSAVLRVTLPPFGHGVNYNRENNPLNSHAAALWLSQVGRKIHVHVDFTLRHIIPIFVDLLSKSTAKEFYKIVCFCF